MSIEYISPGGLHNLPACSQVVCHQRTVYVGGQNAVDTSGQLVREGNIRH